MSVTIALAGNQNSGKTTLFNQFTGNHQYVGNWPGVTVDRKTGTLKGALRGKVEGGEEVQIVDLPGIYSLSPYSNEEVIARTYLAEGNRDVIIDVVDASNLERNLYLATQLMEFGVPLVLALNQMDVVEKRGYEIDSAKLADTLGVPVVEISALKGKGIEELLDAAIRAAKSKQGPKPVKFDAGLEERLAACAKLLPKKTPEALRRYYAIKAFEEDARALEDLEVEISKFEGIIEEAKEHYDDFTDSVITNARYDYVTSFIGEVQSRKEEGLSISEKIDKVLLNRVAALPIFIVIIGIVYYISVSTLGGWATDWANDGLLGDGWFLGGNGNYDEMAEEYDGAVYDIDAYLAAIEENEDLSADAIEEAEYYFGSEAEGDPDSDEATVALDALRYTVYMNGNTPITAYNVDEETSEVEEYELTFEDFEEALAVDEPNPSDYGIWIVGVTAACDAGLSAINTPGWLYSLCIDGIVAGVCAVLGFVPQIMILFFLLAILEGCGYMARVTYILDRIFRRFGLSGKTFIPMLIGTGCGIPGILASRTIENESSRKITVMTTTMMPCGAKLPIISLIAATFLGGAWWAATACYFMGIAAIIVSGIMLKKTKPFMGETTPYIMELPEYRLPRFSDLLRSMWERAWHFIKKAFTIILLATILVWYLSTYGIEGGYCAVEDTENSFLAMLGSVLGWLFVPLGFGNWQATAGTITGLIAKENLVGTMAVIYADPSIAWTAAMYNAFDEIAGVPVVAGVSYLVFNMLCAPCFAAMGCIKREMGGFNRWFWAAIGYEMGFAWCCALMVYQFGKLIFGGLFGPWTVVAIVVLAFFCYMLFRPYPHYEVKEEAPAAA